MKIISGLHKGKIITAPKKISIRPTTSRAKEGLFNILNNWFQFKKIRALDLFSGIGSISFELASRGGNNITAVDYNPLCTKFIRSISNDLELPIKVITKNVFTFLDKNLVTYDLIFADPPFNLEYPKYIEIIEKIFSKGFLSMNGLLIIEHSKKNEFDDNKHFIESRLYGNNVFSLFKK